MEPVLQEKCNRSARPQATSCVAFSIFMATRYSCKSIHADLSVYSYTFFKKMKKAIFNINQFPDSLGKTLKMEH